MNVIGRLTIRNLKVYFRDKISVFFSFLSVIIIISLYALFLGNVQVESIKSQVGGINGIRYLVDSWIMAGVIASNTVTVTLGALGTMVDDIQKDIFQDFMVSPINRRQIVAGYILSSLIVGITMSIVVFIAAELYIVAYGGKILSFNLTLKILGVILACVFSSASMVFFVATFIKTNSAFGTVSTVIGTIIGFVAGIYIPIGALPEGVQKAVKILPISVGVTLLRQIFTKDALSIVFKDAPAEYLNSYMETQGIQIRISGNIVSERTIIAILIISGIIFFALSVFRLLKYKKH